MAAPSHKHSLSMVLVLIMSSVATAQVPCPSRCRSCGGGVADCSRKRLTTPPSEYPEDTRTLDLRDNYIRVLGVASFDTLPSLESLKLSKNRLSAVRNNAFNAFPNLMSLDLSNNQIHRINRRALRNITNLRILSLSQNRIRSLRGVLQGLTEVDTLLLARNLLSSIGEGDFSSMIGVHTLDLKGNNIASIHSRAFLNLPSLRVLYLNNNPLTSLSGLQFGAVSLKNVDLTNCQLTQVPHPLPSTVSELRLGNNNIRQVNHTDFVNMTDLLMVTLDFNQLQVVDDNTFAHSESLHELWLASNQMVYIPRGLPANLKRLNMESNSLASIEPNVFPQDSQLNSIRLDKNRLENIHPDAFAGLEHLTRLNLQDNRIQQIQTGTFRDLTNLRDLFLSSNPIQHIAIDAFQNLDNLTQLYMSYTEEETAVLESNFLAAMPNLRELNLMFSPGIVQEFANQIADSDDAWVQTQLRMLDISYNTLTTLSPKIRQVFPGLRSLGLDGNPFRCSRSLSWLANWMTTGSGMNFATYDQPTCETPYRLQYREIRSMGASHWASEDEADGQPSFQAIQVASYVNDAKVSKVENPKNIIGPKDVVQGKTAKGKKSKNKKGKGKRKGKKNKNKKGGKKGQNKRKNKKDKKRRKKREVFLNGGVPI